MLAKLRCSNHPLSIEKGRHRNIELLDPGKCSRCDEIEDEIHFSMASPLYDLTRNKFLGTSMLNVTSQKQFLYSCLPLESLSYSSILPDVLR